MFQSEDKQVRQKCSKMVDKYCQKEGSEWKLSICYRLRLKLKEVGKTTRRFRYDLNQIPYDGTVDMRKQLRDYV